MNKQQTRLLQIINANRCNVQLLDDDIKSGDIVYMVQPMWFNLGTEMPILGTCKVSKTGDISFPHFGPDYEGIYASRSNFRKVKNTTLPNPFFAGILYDQFNEETDALKKNALILAMFTAHVLRN